MDIIYELNLRSCRTYSQRAGKSEHTRPVNLGQNRFHHLFNFLELENVRNIEIAAASPSGVQAMIAFRILIREGIEKAKVLKDRMSTCKKQKPEEKPEGFYWGMNTENLTA